MNKTGKSLVLGNFIIQQKVISIVKKAKNV